MSRRQRLTLTLILILTFLTVLPLQGEAGHARGTSYLVYVGTFTNGKSQGIYAYRFDPATGKAYYLGLSAATPNPTFLLASKNERYLYAVNELGNGQGEKGNTVSVFRIDSHTGKLVFINKVSSAGAGPCHLSQDHTAKVLLVANCGSGSLALLPIMPDGSLGEATAVVQHQGSSINPVRQKGPHAHGIAISPDNRFALVADLGLDKIFLHPMNPRNRILSAGHVAASVIPGGGVRHLAFHPNGKFLYAIDELDSSLTVFHYTRGMLQMVETLPALPSGTAPAKGGSELEVDRSGHFLYASIRGEQNSIGVFSIDPRSGRLSPIQFISTEGETPRHFAIDPGGAWLAVANQNSHSIVWLRRNAESGRLQSAHRRSQEVDSPTCVVFVVSR